MTPGGGTLDYDYIIVGAGSAGCVLANRLGADPALRILVLEAGPPDRDLMIHIPAGVHAAWKKPGLNWNYRTEAEAALDERTLFTPRGRVVGGSSSINSMVYMRGHPSDYDGWADAPGMADWAWVHCLPYFRAGEASDRGDSPWRGGSGPLGVTRGSFDNPIYDAFIAAADQAGQGVTDDPSGYQPEGVARLDATKRHGRRCSAAVAHLRPALRRGNVTLLTGAAVQRVVFDGRRATGVAFRHRGQDRVAHAGREVLLAGGAINSPQLLMLSGVGPSEQLAAHGIAQIADLPGVGANLQDHACIILQFACPVGFPIHRVDRPLNKLAAGARWVFTRDGIAASNIWEVGGLIRGNDAVDYANLQYHLAPVGFAYQGEKITLSQGFAVHVDVLRPRSRGRVALISANPEDNSLIRFNYYADPGDMEQMVDGVEKTRDLVAQSAFDGLRGAAISPGPGVQTREDIRAWIRTNSDSDFHPCGTCRMGVGDDAVVDPEGRVHGVEGLRVVDASVMPTILSGNLNAPVQMIAAKIADRIAGRAQLAAERPGYAFDGAPR